MKKRLVVSLSLLLITGSAWAQESAWIGSWGASPLPPGTGVGPFPATPSFADQTIRQIVRLSAGGDAIRLRLTNEYGTKPLTIGAARVALIGSDGQPDRGTERTVTFSGDTSTIIPTGAPLLSDDIELAVDDLSVLSISLYFPGETGPCTCHSSGMQETFVSETGDHTSGSFAPAETIQDRAFLSGIDVRSSADSVIVTLGDSITDGIGSTANANRRWPDLLAERLSASGGTFGVVNHGISGNRVLSDGAGDSALARLDRDVLSVARATHVIVFEGINDLGIGFGNFGDGNASFLSLMPEGVAASEANMIAGYRQLIARAHAAGLKIYGATIAPYQGAAYYSDEGESVRQALNSWIRDSGEFDAVLDFDAVLRNPDQPRRIKDGFHAGDFLHGSDAGYRAMAESIDLSLFE